MIFKPSNLHKLFFTYICPRFYGGAPAAPSNTTSTSTVNQSPWQNPVYQALMLGTADKPGPATSMLNASRDQMAQWNAINKTGLTPSAQASLGTWNPPGSTSSYINNLNPATGQYTPTVNPNVTNLKQDYQTSLGRAPDASGQNYWLGRLNNGMSQQDVAKSIAASQEAQAYTAKNTPAASPIEQSAAQGGLMGLRGYASGGTIDPVQQTAIDLFGRELSAADLASYKYYSALGYGTPAQLMQRPQNSAELDAWKAAPPEKKAAAYQKIVDAGGTLSDTQNAMLSNFNTYKPQIDAGTLKLDASGNPAPVIKQGATKAETDAANAAFTKATGTEGTTGQAPYGLMDTMKKTAFIDPTTGQSTLADFQSIQDTARNLQTPEQFAAATDMYGQSTAGLQAAAGYKPTDVNANQANVTNAASQGYNAANMGAPSNIEAQKAGVTNAEATGYTASNMNAPSNIGAQKANVVGVDTTGYVASNMKAPSNIGAQKADVSTMQGAGPVSADKLSQYKMQGPEDVNAPTAAASQMQGPASWLTPGTAAAYMDPYAQNVINQEKAQSNRDYQQQLNQLNAQSVKAGAFGGSRQAIQQSEAARNQLFNLANIEAKGLSDAYTQGAAQFNTAQGQGLQAGQANLGASQQTTLANQQAQIQAMMANQGMDYNTAVQNLQAQLGIQNTQAGQDLQAALANQSTQQQTQSTNMGAQNQASQAYVQQALQAAQANQGAQLTAAQQNQIAQNAAAQYAATNQQQGNLATQQATNQAQNAYVQQALQAAQANQGAQLTAAQQNQVAQNAAAQYTATNQQQANLTNAGASNQAQNAYVQQALQAAQANQGAQLTTAQQNQVAQNAAAQFTSGATNTANLANQQAANTASNNLTQQQLAAQQANQQAGLTANQQGIGALQGVASNASGLTGTGSAANAANLANLGAQGQVAQAEQNLGQSYLDTQSSNAASWLNAPTSINAGAANVLNAQPVSGGTTTSTGTTAPAHWARGGLIKNGKVSKGSKK